MVPCMSSVSSSNFPNEEFFELQERFQSAFHRNLQPHVEDFLAQVAEPHREMARTLLLRLQEELQSVPASVAAPADPPELPKQIDRFTIVRLIGKGGFAWVYEARDPVLQTLRALKMPRSERLADSRDRTGGTAFIDELERFRTEARNLAQIDHPAVVRVFDVVSHGDFPVIVQEYIDGCDLDQHLKREYRDHGRMVPVDEAVRLITTICRGLRAAHAKRIYHRDLKPGNILLDRRLEPKIADFGLALHNTQLPLHNSRVEGTMSYMAPEQIDGLTAKIDGRTDIWAVGVMLYEMLAGERPFSWPETGTQQEIYQRARISIHQSDPPPLREVRDDVPEDLIRICRLCLEKRKDDRYDSVQSLCDDLELLQAAIATHSANVSSGTAPRQPGRDSTDVTEQRFRSTDSASQTLSSSVQPAPVIARGLLAFSHEDRDFFLQLLPGTRDRYGLPPAVAFWKNRIEAGGTLQTFSVGLLYGPSGSGKSSLMKAGILPRLSDSVLSVYLECTAVDTEERLRRKLRDKLPGLPDGQLPELMRLIQQGDCLRRGQKVLLVLDQFEQWLNCHRSSPVEPLTFALQHCDGPRLQAILMVRDEFFHPAEDLLGQLDIRAVEGQNKRRLDLFEPQHALRVLTLFGQARHRLPMRSSEQTVEQTEFLQEAIEQLTSPQTGRVISVHLALFVQMYGGRPWSRETLTQLGGTEGLGLRFLQESFERREYQLYASAAQSVLRQLLPPAGRDLKGTLQPASALFTASGLEARPERFSKLLRILEEELRLITPTASADSLDGQPAETNPAELYYQLTHDYLVAPLREWLASKQRETARGRAELILEERTAEWLRKQHRRDLLSLREFIQIRRYLKPVYRSSEEQQLIQASARFHAARLAASALLLTLLLVLGILTGISIQHAKSSDFADKVADFDLRKLPEYLSSSQEHREALPYLKRAFNNAAADSESALKLAIARLRFKDNPAVLAPVVAHLATISPPEDLETLAELLGMCWSHELNDHLQKILRRALQTTTPKQQLHAACLLANITITSPEHPPEHPPSDSLSVTPWHWESAPAFVAREIARQNTAAVGTYRRLLRPAARQLVQPLAELFREQDEGEVAAAIVAETLTEFAADDTPLLVRLLLDADPRQHEILLPRLSSSAPAIKELWRLASVSSVEDEKMAAAAVALLQLDTSENARDFLQKCSGPEVQGRILDRLARYHTKSFQAPAIDPPEAIQLFQILRMAAQDRQVTPLLILGLGKFAENGRLRIAPQVADILRSLYETHPDPAIHGACEWSLRQLDHGQAVKEITARLSAGYVPETERRWYVTRGPVSITLARLDPTDSFLMGSPETEEFRFAEETQHSCRIPRSFFMGMHEVTVAQFRAFRPEHGRKIGSLQSRFAETDDCPAMELSWYDAAEFCNWLSEQENIPRDQWCYEPDQSQPSHEIQLRDNYLQLEGYRLPSEAEWEYACRSNTTTARFFGERDTLLRFYGWYSGNTDEKAVRPVGTRLPNGFGLFDLYGNVFEWCLDPAGFYHTESTAISIDTEKKPEESSPFGEDSRILRGGSFENSAVMARSANRFFRPADSTGYSNGFRIARTLPRQTAD